MKVSQWILATLGAASLTVLSASDGRPRLQPRTRPDAARVSPPALPVAPAAPLWVKTYGGTDSDHGLQVKVSADGGYYLAGDTASFGAGQEDLYLMKVDASGGLLWNRTYGTSGQELGSVFPLPSGGFLALGTSTDLSAQSTFFLARLSEDGSIQWQKKYGPASNGLSAAVPTADGGFLVSGFSLSFMTFQSSVKILRLDSGGDILWQKEFSAPGQIAGAFFEAGDGSILGSGTIVDLTSQDSDIWAARLDAAGDVLWQKTYGGPSLDTGGGLWPLSSGGYLLQGTTRSFGAGGSGSGDIWILRLEADGGIVWQKTYGGTQDEWGFVQPIPAGGFFVAGDTESFGAGGHDLWLLRLDDSGNILWQKAMGGSHKDEPDSAEVLPDGSFLVGATTESFGHGMDDLWLLRLTSSGNLLFQRAYGGTEREEAAAEGLPDGGIFAFGETKSTGTGNSDLFALRLDGNGSVGSACSLISDTAAPGVATAVTPGTSSAAVGSPGFTASPLAFTAVPMNLQPGSSVPSVSGLCAYASTLAATASASPESGTAPLEVSFSASASGGDPPYAYAWDFGDGATSASQNPLHTYSTAGHYPVVLTVTDGASDTASDPHLAIHVSAQGCSLACSAIVPGSAEAGQNVVFSGSATPSGCPGTPSYDWNFGDGTAHAVTASAGHTYASPGAYTWSFTAMVQGALPCTQTGTLTVTGSTGGCTIACEASVPAMAEAGQSVAFNGSVTATGCSDAPTVDWDFGDGSPHGSVMGAGHSYASAGTYTWTLTVREGNGNDACSRTGTITVSAASGTPPAVSAIVKKGNPFRFVVTGSGFESGMQLYIEGQLWSQVTRKSSTQLILKGGASLKGAVPKNTPRALRFLNPDGGEVTVIFQWP